MNRLKINAAYEPLFGLPDRRYVVLTGGRGSGKSFALSTCLALMMREPGYRILFTRYTLTSAKDSIIPEFQEKVERLGLAGEFVPTASNIRNRMSGSEILFRGIRTASGNQTAKLKSLQGINSWVLDEAEELPDYDTFEKIDLSVRDTRKRNHVFLCLNPAYKQHWIYQRWFKNGPRDDTVYIHTDYRNNLENLPPDVLRLAEECKTQNLRRYRQVWIGDWMDEVSGALFQWKLINDGRVTRDLLPQLARVVIAVDPAVTSTSDSDETGIVAAGKGANGHYYVLTDASLRASPLTWAAKTCSLYHKHGADRVIGETNNGGDLVESNIRSVDPHISYRGVHASRGKLVRAEPISSLYEQGLVHHVGTFADLEDEMVSYTGQPNEASPNRMDALVWALTELSGGNRSGAILPARG